MKTQIITEFPIVFFDAQCHLCNSSVAFLIKRDTKRCLHYAPLSGKTAQQLLPPQETLPQSLIFYENQKIYSRTEAVLQLVNYLPWPWQILKIGYVIPRCLRHKLYDFIARYRYRWFGEVKTCSYFSVAEQALFLE